ncbi:unnamed protein product [Rotaria sp. Silwood2]|nr:unnamed protein product [Rotaria sp. Silwood2]CAF4610986.1 unnamed protein product [Rotaria sp. Silwood2]
MDTSNYNHLNILDLPNEILAIIFNKLNMVDVFYSLVDVNDRFNRLIFYPLFVRHLDMIIDSSSHHVILMDKQISKICDNVLSRIHHQITQITVEPHSIRRILTFNYSHLYSLSLVNFPESMLYEYFIGMLFCSF